MRCHLCHREMPEDALDAIEDAFGDEEEYSVFATCERCYAPIREAMEMRHMPPHTPGDDLPGMLWC